MTTEETYINLAECNPDTLGVYRVDRGTWRQTDFVWVIATCEVEAITIANLLVKTKNQYFRARKANYMNYTYDRITLESTTGTWCPWILSGKGILRWHDGARLRTVQGDYLHSFTDLIVWDGLCNIPLYPRDRPDGNVSIQWGYPETIPTTTSTDDY